MIAVNLVFFSGALYFLSINIRTKKNFVALHFYAVYVYSIDLSLYNIEKNQENVFFKQI